MWREVSLNLHFLISTKQTIKEILFKILSRHCQRTSKSYNVIIFDQCSYVCESVVLCVTLLQETIIVQKSEHKAWCTKRFYTYILPSNICTEQKSSPQICANSSSKFYIHKLKLWPVYIYAIIKCYSNSHKIKHFYLRII